MENQARFTLAHPRFPVSAKRIFFANENYEIFYSQNKLANKVNKHQQTARTNKAEKQS